MWLIATTVSHRDFPDPEGEEDSNDLDNHLVPKQYPQPHPPPSWVTQLHKVVYSDAVILGVFKVCILAMILHKI